VKNNKEYILEKAFQQYLLNGHEGVSISVLQESLDMGRATLYYYFSSKENLFRQVVEKYFFDIVTEGQSHINKKTITVPELIEIFLGLYQKIKVNLLKTNLPDVSFSNLTSLILHANAHYPDLAERTDEIKKSVFSAWKCSIKNSMQRGEVKQNVDVDSVATIFTNIKEGYEYGIKRESVATEKDEYHYRKACYCLYDLIKI
jgi:AcrR family transcriptional regulator